jgi:hypothetical protein
MMNGLVSECKQACQTALDEFKEEAKGHNENIWDLKTEYENSQMRMRKERADLQMMQGQVKTQSE